MVFFGGGIDGGGGVGGRSTGESPGVLERGGVGVGGGGGGILEEWKDFLSSFSPSWKRARNCGTPMRECGPRKRKKIEEIHREIFLGERSN